MVKFSVQRSGMRISFDQISAALLAFSGALCLALSPSANAAECTTDGWSSVVGASSISAGNKSDGFLVASGACSLNVTLQGGEAYLVDDSPLDERRFNTRFFFNLSDVADDAVIYQAMDGAETVFAASYSAVDERIQVSFSGSPSTAVSLGPVAAGWNALEIRWASDAQATPSAVLTHASGSQTVVSEPTNTSNLLVDAARLGVGRLDSTQLPTSGTIFFDEYVSRRDALDSQPFAAQTEAGSGGEIQPSDGRPVAIPLAAAWSLLAMALALWLSTVFGRARGRLLPIIEARH